MTKPNSNPKNLIPKITAVTSKSFSKLFMILKLYMLKRNWKPVFSYTGVSYKGRWNFLKFSFHVIKYFCTIEIKSWCLSTEKCKRPLMRQSSPTKWSEREALLSPGADTQHSGGTKGSLLQTLAQMSCFYKLAKIQGLGTPKYLSYHCTGFAEVLAVLPPFPITLPAAKDGTLMWASSFTSSLGLTKFSSLIFP